VFDQGGGREACLGWVRGQFLGQTGASKLKGKTGVSVTFLAVPDTTDLVAIVELT
jgi:hypothetical protein